MTNAIKMVDLQTQYLQLKPEIDAAIQQVLHTTAFIQGPEVNAFAEALSNYLKAGFVIPCANGTDALQIAMMALDLSPGDEVILPVHTYVATAEVIALLKLTPVFVDVDKDTFTLDVNQLADKITARTKAIVPVHLYGQCADMEPILALAEKNNLFVIEDNAQALGADYMLKNGTHQKAGTLSTIGTTSFFPTKNLGCFGDGGALFTNDALLAEKIRIIANHGQRKKYHHEVVGVNSRLDTLQAAILTVKLKHLDRYTHERNRAAEFYDHALVNIPEIQLPVRAKNSTHVFHQYTIKVEQRDALKDFLQKNGIPSIIYYPIPLHLQNAYRNEPYGVGAFPVTEYLSTAVLSLPIYPGIPTDALSFICETILKFFRDGNR